MDQIKQWNAREKATGHSIFSPSQLPRIVLCPASVKESTYAPLSEPSSYAKRGTYLHTIPPQTWVNGLQWLKRNQLKLDLNLDEYNWLVDCQEYLAKVMKAPTLGSDDIKFESEIDLSAWGLREIWGTSDVSIVDHVKRHAWVIDWKFGAGVQVYVQNNEQLMAYAAGVVGVTQLLDKITLVIGQPPLNHWDEWEIKYTDLVEWVMNVLSPAIDKARDPNCGEYHPGEKQCRFCPAGMTCRARHKSTLAGAQKIFETYSDMNQVTKAELAKVLRKADEYDAYIKAIRQYALQELLKGRPFPTFKLVAGRSTRKWMSEDSAYDWLSSHSSIRGDQMYKKTLISPSQAEKLDKELKKDKSFQALVHKPEGAPKLVPDEDKRPPISPTKDATDVFAEFAYEE